MNFEPIPLTLGYHIPCQYRAHRIGKPGIEVIKLIPGLNIIDSQASCCGIAGTYGYKTEKYKYPWMLVSHFFPLFPKENASKVPWWCATVKHVAGKSPMPLESRVHPVELIAKSYGLPVDGALEKYWLISRT